MLQTYIFEKLWEMKITKMANNSHHNKMEVCSVECAEEKVGMGLCDLLESFSLVFLALTSCSFTRDHLQRKHPHWRLGD